jgi:hypothetical protein
MNKDIKFIFNLSMFLFGVLLSEFAFLLFSRLLLLSIITEIIYIGILLELIKMVLLEINKSKNIIEIILIWYIIIILIVINIWVLINVNNSLPMIFIGE